MEELIEGLNRYVAQARSCGYRVYAGTLLPMGGWRTDDPFRQKICHAYNAFIRTTDLIDGYIDFDKGLQAPDNPAPQYASGNHLYTSPAGYKRMGQEIPEELLK